ncbi:MAG: sulfatase [Alphaproteobacteria bacterium]|nr:sulfatase [Alphaproteobacteria bacterium]
MTRSPGGSDAPVARRIAAATDGAVLGGLLWAAEVTALAVGVLGVGGVSVLATLRDDLAAWGVAYIGLGAVLGLASLTRSGRFGPVLGWLVLVAVADVGVVPRPLHVGLLALGCVAWAFTARLPAMVRTWSPVLAAVLLVGVALWPTARPVVSGTRGAGPDVVLVVVDTLRADHVGAYGYGRDTTPSIDALAREGLRFTGARASSSWTLPSHASLFTGLAPSRHGAHAGNPHLREDVETLAEAFDRRGYRTVGLSANAWVSGGTGLDRGFEDFRFLGDDGLASQLLLPLVVRRPKDLGGRAIADAAVRAAAEAHAAGEPLFLFVNLLEAHEPLGTLPKADRSRFGPVDAMRARGWMRDMPLFWCVCEGSGEPVGDEPACVDGAFRVSDDRARATTDAYDAGVRYADARVGEIVAAFGPDALVAVTSDHGERLGEHGQLGHMVWLDDVLLDVPLVVRGPGLPRGAIDAGPFDLADLGAWMLARLDGWDAPRATLATSEVHPHPTSTTDAWGALFGCDFAPAEIPRRAVKAADRTVWRDGDAVRTVQSGVSRAPTPDEAAWVAGPFAEGGAPVDPGTRAALEVLGYVE